MSDLLPLANRYSAAWIEHGTRVGQRQNVVQIYLAMAGALFGFYFNNASRRQEHDLNMFLAIAATSATVACTLLIWMHHRVMQNLCKFMKNCEKYAEDSIKKSGRDSNDLFYFYCPDTKKIDPFHSSQRLLHRFVLSGLLVGTNTAALLLSWHTIEESWRIGCIVSLVLATVIPYLDWYKDHGT